MIKHGYSSRAVAERAAEPYRRMLAKPVRMGPTVTMLVEHFATREHKPFHQGLAQQPYRPQIWEYAMYRGDVEVQRNLMELIRIKGSNEADKKATQSHCGGISAFRRATKRTIPNDGARLRIVWSTDQ